MGREKTVEVVHREQRRYGFKAMVRVHLYFNIYIYIYMDIINIII